MVLPSVKKHGNGFRAVRPLRIEHEIGPRRNQHAILGPDEFLRHNLPLTVDLFRAKLEDAGQGHTPALHIAAHRGILKLPAQFRGKSRQTQNKLLLQFAFDQPRCRGPDVPGHRGLLEELLSRNQVLENSDRLPSGKRVPTVLVAITVQAVVAAVLCRIARTGA